MLSSFQRAGHTFTRPAANCLGRGTTAGGTNLAIPFDPAASRPLSFLMNSGGPMMGGVNAGRRPSVPSSG